MNDALALKAMQRYLDQIVELEDRNRDLAGANRVLSEAIRDVEAEAQDNLDLGRDDLNRIIHICSTGGVRTAMNEASS